MNAKVCTGSGIFQTRKGAVNPKQNRQSGRSSRVSKICSTYYSLYVCVRASRATKRRNRVGVREQAGPAAYSKRPSVQIDPSIVEKGKTRQTHWWQIKCRNRTVARVSTDHFRVGYDRMCVCVCVCYSDLYKF